MATSRKGRALTVLKALQQDAACAYHIRVPPQPRHGLSAKSQEIIFLYCFIEKPRPERIYLHHLPVLAQTVNWQVESNQILKEQGVVLGPSTLPWFCILTEFVSCTS